MARRGKRGGRNRSKSTATATASTNTSNGHGSGVKESAAAGAAAKYDGAGASPRRGMVQWATLDAKKEVTARTRKELMKRARWGEANIGLVKRCNQGVNNLVGYQVPQARSGDAEWNKRAEEIFARRVDHPLAFDMAGKLDFKQWQMVSANSRRRDGDAITVLAKGSTGGARFMFYEGHQVDNGDKDESDNFRDGIYLDRMGRHVAYNLVSGSRDNTKGTRVPARDAIYHNSLVRPSHIRGVSNLSHAISNIVDMVEILADTKHAIKVAALWGIAMETVGGGGQSGMSEELMAFLGGGNDGASTEEEVSVDNLLVENIQQGGRVQSLPGGATLKTLSDTRPHPNQMNLLSWLVRDIAWGVGLAPEILWDMSQMNGTSVRYLMADTRRWVENEQRLQRRDCQRVWNYVISLEMAEGRLDLPNGGDFMKVDWIAQEDMTIDKGRDGKMAIARVDARLSSRSRECKKMGWDWEEIEAELKREESMMTPNTAV